MSGIKSNLKVIDINIEDDKSSRISGEEASQLSFADSDLNEFQKMEEEMYGDDMEHDDNGLEEYDEEIVERYDYEEETEATESLEFIKPVIKRKPSLGDAISTYDKLQVRYSGNFEESEFQVKPNLMQPKRSLVSPVKSQPSSRNSKVSVETVLSQDDEEENNNRADKDYDQNDKSFLRAYSSNSEREGSKTPTAMSRYNSDDDKLKQKLAHEQAKSKEQEKYIDLLNQSLQKLQSKHALAEETIDQLRLGVEVNANANKHGLSRVRLRRKNILSRGPGVDKTSTSSLVDNPMSRRFSSFVPSTLEMASSGSPLGIVSRAKSVDLELYDEAMNSKSLPTSPTNSSPSTLLGSIQRLTEQFQTRAEVVEQELQDLHLNLGYLSSSSSGSPYHNQQNGVVRLSPVRQQQRYMLQDRLKNIQGAYQNIEKDFKQAQQRFGGKQLDSESNQAYLDFKDQIDGQLFSLSMQLDNLQHKIDEHDLDLIGKTDEARTSELMSRVEDLEMQYDNLLDRYQQIRQQNTSTTFNSDSSTPGKQSAQSLLDVELAQVQSQLSQLVQQSRGQSRNIPSNQQQLQAVLGAISRPSHQMVTTPSNDGDSISLDLRNSLPEYGSKAATLDPILRVLSPIKSRRSSRSVNGIPTMTTTATDTHHEPPSNQSGVSSASMWRGANSGDTLLMDDNGILRERPLFKSSSRHSSFNDKYRTGSTSLRDSSIGVDDDDDAEDEEEQEEQQQEKETQFKTAKVLNRSSKSNGGNLDDDIRLLDHQLAMAELEEHNQLNNSRSNTGLSHNTRSMLDSATPSMASGSRSGAVDHNKSLRHSSSLSNKSLDQHSGTLPKHYSKSRKSPSYYKPALISSASPHYPHRLGSNSLSQPLHRNSVSRPLSYHQQHYSSSDNAEQVSDDSSSNDSSTGSVIDTARYIQTAQSGSGQRSKYVRDKVPNSHDKWCQTPVKYRPHKDSRSSASTSTNGLPHRYDRRKLYRGNLPGDLDNYQDYVDYWDGEQFHPARENLPGKSILRPSSKHALHHCYDDVDDADQYPVNREKLRSGPHMRRKKPSSSRNHTGNRLANRNSYCYGDYPDNNNNNGALQFVPKDSHSVRQYANIGPHKYFVREYGDLRRQPSNPYMLGEDNNYTRGSYESDDSADDQNSSPDYLDYQKILEERRLCRYLDEAIRAARSMKQYTRHMTDTVAANGRQVTTSQQPITSVANNRKSNSHWSPLDLSELAMSSPPPPSQPPQLSTRYHNNHNRAYSRQHMY